MEGTRPLLVEVQALVAPTEIVPTAAARQRDRSQSPGDRPRGPRPPRRRLARRRRRLRQRRRRGPGRRARRRPRRRARARLGPPRRAARRAGRRPLACFGEVGLTGELRYVAHAERRLAEARKFGLEPVLAPAADEPLAGLAPCSSLREALRAARGNATTGTNRRAACRPGLRAPHLTTGNPICPHGIREPASLQAFLRSWTFDGIACRG